MDLCRRTTFACHVHGNTHGEADHDGTQIQSGCDENIQHDGTHDAAKYLSIASYSVLELVPNLRFNYLLQRLLMQCVICLS